MPADDWRARLAMRAARTIAGGTWNSERRRELSGVFDLKVYRVIRDDLATQAVLSAVLRSDSHVIDVGAHRGDVLEQVIRLCPNGRFLAYEPIPDLARELAAKFPDATVRQAALSDETGNTTFQHVLHQPAYSGLLLRADIPGEGQVEPIKVELRRLDDDLPNEFRPAVIKVDVEGAEVRVLRGATETLHRFRPIVIFEHGHSDLYDTTSDELWDLLTECGYRIFNMEGAGPYSLDQFRTPAPEWNFLAIPS